MKRTLFVLALAAMSAAPVAAQDPSVMATVAKFVDSFNFKQHGKAVKESSSLLTIVLQKGATGWLIAAWTWSKH